MSVSVSFPLVPEEWRQQNAQADIIGHVLVRLVGGNFIKMLALFDPVPGVLATTHAHDPSYILCVGCPGMWSTFIRPLH
jgi:hypothetical protein